MTYPFPKLPYNTSLATFSITTDAGQFGYRNWPGHSSGSTSTTTDDGRPTSNGRRQFTQPTTRPSHIRGLCRTHLRCASCEIVRSPLSVLHTVYSAPSSAARPPLRSVPVQWQSLPVCARAPCTNPQLRVCSEHPPSPQPAQTSTGRRLKRRTSRAAPPSFRPARNIATLHNATGLFPRPGRRRRACVGRGMRGRPGHGSSARIRVLGEGLGAGEDESVGKIRVCGRGCGHECEDARDWEVRRYPRRVSTCQAIFAMTSALS